MPGDDGADHPPAQTGDLQKAVFDKAWAAMERGEFDDALALATESNNTAAIQSSADSSQGLIGNETWNSLRGAVHGHRDPTKPGRRHLRCKVFLRTPEDGGMPVVEGEVHEVGDGDLLAFFPSEKRRRSEAVHGGAAQVICSFGYLVPLGYRLPPQPARSPEGHGLHADHAPRGVEQLFRAPHAPGLFGVLVLQRPAGTDAPTLQVDYHSTLVQ